MHSKVLEKMLFGSMQESLSENQVIIPDVSPKAFKYFNLLIYSYSPQLNYDIVIDVLYLSKKYLMMILMKECKDHILLTNNLSDFYKILQSYIKYPPSTFIDSDDNDLIDQYLLKCKYLKINTKQHILSVFQSNLFLKLPIYLICKIIKSKSIFIHEQNKYIYLKRYCLNIDNTNWQNIFKINFLSLIDFSRIKSDFLLSTIGENVDNILTDKQLLEIWKIKTKRDKPGFKIEELLLSYDECIQLLPNDIVDIRCCNGEIVTAVVNNNDGNNNEIKILYKDNIKEYINMDDQRLLINASISQRNHIIKPCMQNLCINQLIFINMAYLPSKAYDIKCNKKWIMCKIIGFNKNKQQIKVRSIGDKMDGDYYFHPDSKDEVACSSECEYCQYDNN